MDLHLLRMSIFHASLGSVIEIGRKGNEFIMKDHLKETGQRTV